MLLKCEECLSEFKGHEGHRFCTKSCRLLWENKQINLRWEKKELVKPKPKPTLNLGSLREW